MPSENRISRVAGNALAACALIAGCADADQDVDRPEENRQPILKFHDLAINRKYYAATEKFIGPHYIQHNPNNTIF